jgi:hypothetical protein
MTKRAPKTPAMTPQFKRELLELLEANRARALWWVDADFVPQTPEAARRVLEKIAARGDRATFIKARGLLAQLKDTPAA